MKMRSAFVWMAAAISIASAADAQQRDVSRYSRVLIPFDATVSRADGTWQVSWWIRNDADRPVDVFPVALGGGLPPPPEFRDFVFVTRYPAVGPRSTLKTPAGDVIRFSPYIPSFVPVRTNTGAAFVYVENEGKSSLAIAGTLAWRSSTVQAPPTALRAIPVDAFLAGTHSIVAVPYLAGARYDVRIYALPETVAKGGVTIRIYDVQAAGDSPDDALLETRTAAIESPVASLSPCFDPCDVPTTDLAPAGLQVINLFEPHVDPRFFAPHAFRIEIEPESAEMRWWAVVSAMDAETRQVWLYQPSF
jgi:hypothetical protein